MQLYKRTSMIVYSILIFRILFWFYRISLFFWRDYYALDLPQKLFFVVVFIVSIYIFEIWCILSFDEEFEILFFLCQSLFGKPWELKLEKLVSVVYISLTSCCLKKSMCHQHSSKHYYFVGPEDNYLY